jgi:putative hydrolase
MANSSKHSDRPGLIFRARDLDLAALPRIDSHLHTSWTDGESTVQEVYGRAVECGLSTILYSEHSRKTSTDWFSQFAAQVRALPAASCHAYVGTECKIETVSGDIDTIPAISDLCDFVMASVHRFMDLHSQPILFDKVPLDKAVEMEFAYTWAALAHPQVDILGHVFGMSYRRYKLSPADEQIRALIERAARFDVAVEVNSHYHPEPHKMIQWCREFDSLITFGSNAHKLQEVGAIMRMLDEKPDRA